MATLSDILRQRDENFGPVGFTGSAGPQGPVGFTGSVGSQGPVGFTGSKGVDGLGNEEALTLLASLAVALG